MRRITGDKLLEVPRTHLGTPMRDAAREVLALRHFEPLTNIEEAQELDLDPSAASKGYIRALARLQKSLRALGLVDGG